MKRANGYFITTEEAIKTLQSLPERDRFQEFLGDSCDFRFLYC